VDGLQKLSVDLNVSGHPLEYCEKHYHENREKNDFLMLRNIQGLHAPLRLKTEREIASRMQRLPGLPSSNLMSDILTGRLDTIDFEDFLCDPMDAEIVGQPHILMERRSGI
jgi:proteasome maturation protein